MVAHWKKYEEAAEHGPWPIIWRAGLLLVAVTVVFGTMGYVLGWFGEAMDVAREQVGPRAALAKYEWFIDQATRIEKMDKDVQMFEKRAAGVDEKYKTYGEDKSKWQPHVQVQYNRESQQARDDLIAVTSQRNALVREYNAASEKFNWKPFESRSDLPKPAYEVK